MERKHKYFAHEFYPVYLENFDNLKKYSNYVKHIPIMIYFIKLECSNSSKYFFLFLANDVSQGWVLRPAEKNCLYLNTWGKKAIFFFKCFLTMLFALLFWNYLKNWCFLWQYEKLEEMKSLNSNYQYRCLLFFLILFYF